MKKITKIEPLIPPIPKRIRTAAYVRVSSEKDAMLHSLSAQVSYFNEYIQNDPKLEYVGVYCDDPTTGTKDDRPEFQRMLDDCRAGKIDYILCKAISRFMRNTLSMLEVIRELKELGIDIYFVNDNLHTMSGDGELMLTILSSFAQAESLSVSENCKWRIRNDFKLGKICSITMLGYRRTKDGQLEIEPAEAETVRMIFNDYLSGMGRQAITNKLNDMGIPTRRGTMWNQSAVMYILKQEKYIGSMLLQKTFRENHLTKRKVYNTGQLPMQLVENSHEAIIDKAIFDTVQAEIKRRSNHNPNSTIQSYPFTSLITCGKCGKHYRRKITASGTKYEKPVWICTTFNSRGKKHCDSKQIPEDILMNITAEFDMSEIQSITVPADHRLVFLFHGGTTVEREWQYPSRSDSWNATNRQAQSEIMRRLNQ